jgi:hypothetical protein
MGGHYLKRERFEGSQAMPASPSGGGKTFYRIYSVLTVELGGGGLRGSENLVLLWEGFVGAKC